MSSPSKKSKITLSGSKLLEVFTVVTPLFMGAMGLAWCWPNSSFSTMLVNRLEPTVAVEHMPMFAIMCIFTTWLATILFYLVGVSATRPGGVDNNNPRGVSRDTSLGWVYRMHCAHQNTTECLVWFTATTVVANQMKLDPLLQAKWSLLVMCTRFVYPMFYAFDIDILRTSIFAVGFFSAMIMGWTAVFQESMVPFFT